MSSFEFNLHDIHLDQQGIVDTCAFSIKQQGTAALIGPSGCGKTTMLNVIAGLLKFPHLNTFEDTKLSYIFQDARLIPWLNIEQNLSLIDPSLSSSEIRQLLLDVKLTDVANVYPIQLSGGMQRRVSIARAFVNKPQIVLLDEPFNSLDSPTSHYLQKLVKTLLDKNQASALLVTHNLQEALAMADDLYFLSNKPTRIIKHIANPLFAHQINVQFPETAQLQAQEHAILSQYPKLLLGEI